jgi:anti-sigma factor RsiW
MTCAQALRVQAYFDGEMDPDEAASIDNHLLRCAACRALLDELGETRAALRDLPRMRAPAALRARILDTLDAEDAAAGNAGAAQSAPLESVVGRSWRRAAMPARPFWFGAFTGLGLSALAAAIFAFVMLPMSVAPIVDGLTSAHLQSLRPEQLVQVASSAHHTVKPWFGGRADVSPTVADFDAQGFTLLGGRADPLLGQRAAVTVYRHGKHTINVFAWANKNTFLPGATSRNGYRLLFWRSDDLAYCAVSDTTWNAMEELRGLIQAQSAAERRVENADGLRTE